MKILQIRSEFRDNGPGTQALTLGNELRRRGHEVAYASSGGVLVPRIEEQGFEFHEVPSLAVDRRSPVDSIRTVSRLRSLIRKHRFDILHGHNAASIVLASLAARLAGVAAKPVQSVRGIELRKNYQWRNWIYRVNPAHLLAVSDFTRRELLRLGARDRDITVTYNGVDLSRFDPAEVDGDDLRRELDLGDGPVIGHVGKFSGAKGQQVLVAALPEIHRQFPGVRAVFVGDGPTLEEVKQLARDLGVDTLTRFAGLRLDVPRFQSIFDLYTQPSTWGEMFPNAILEAMAMQRPWVGSDISGLSELTDDGKAGIVVKPDDADVLADTIVGLLADTGKLHAMGRHAREFVVGRFTVERVADTVEGVYRAVSGQRAHLPAGGHAGG